MFHLFLMSCDMIRFLRYIIPFFAVLVFSCEKAGEDGGGSSSPPQSSIPAPDEFIILSWSDIIDANAKWKLELMKEAYLEEKDMRSLIQIKGMGCGCGGCS